MPIFTPPAANAVDFALASFVAPAATVVDFDMGTTVPPSYDLTPTTTTTDGSGEVTGDGTTDYTQQDAELWRIRMTYNGVPVAYTHVRGVAP